MQNGRFWQNITEILICGSLVLMHFGDDGVYCQVTYGLWKRISNAYVFGVDTLLVDNHNRLNHISLYSPRFAVYASEIPGGIRVGRKKLGIPDEINEYEFYDEPAYKFIYND